MDKNSKIHAAATEMFEQLGKRPTISQIREHMGSGSFSTITKAMQIWQQPGAPVQQPEQQPAAQEGSKEVFDPNAVPDALQLAVMTAVQQVWTTAKTEADERIAQIQAAAAAQAEALQTALAKTEAAAAEAAEAAEADHQVMIDELCAEIEEKEKSLNTTIDRNIELQKHNTELEGVRRELLSDLKDADNLFKQAEEKLAYYKDAIKDMQEEASIKSDKLTADLATATANAAAAAEAQDSAIKKADKLQEENTKTVERAAKAAGRIEELEKQIKALQQANKDNTKK